MNKDLSQLNVDAGENQSLYENEGGENEFVLVDHNSYLDDSQLSSSAAATTTTTTTKTPIQVTKRRTNTGDIQYPSLASQETEVMVAAPLTSVNHTAEQHYPTFRRSYTDSRSHMNEDNNSDGVDDDGGDDVLSETAIIKDSEDTLQTWIQRVLNVSFNEELNFYENLESGVILCTLIDSLIKRINQKKQQQQQEVSTETILEVNHVKWNLKRENDAQYVISARNNIKLFLAACRSINVQQLFTFEDIYLQNNKINIIGCLMELYQKYGSVRNDDDDDDDEVVDENSMFRPSAPPISSQQEQNEKQQVQNDTIRNATPIKENKKLPQSPKLESKEKKTTPSKSKATKQKQTSKSKSNKRPDSQKEIHAKIQTETPPKRQKIDSNISTASTPQLTRINSTLFAAKLSEEAQSQDDGQWGSDSQSVSLATMLQTLFAVFLLPMVLVYVMIMKLKELASKAKE